MEEGVGTAGGGDKIAETTYRVSSFCALVIRFKRSSFFEGVELLGKKSEKLMVLFNAQCVRRILGKHRTHFMFVLDMVSKTEKPH